MPIGIPALLSVPTSSEPILDRGEVNTTIRNYETMYIIDTTNTDEQVDSIIAKYSQLVTDQGGEMQAVGRWDKRRLAYEIKGRREGIYILMFFTGEPEVASELDRVFRISDEVIRHLITRVEPKNIDTSRIEHPQQAATETAAQPAEAPAEKPAVVEEAKAEEPAQQPEAEAVAAPESTEETTGEETNTEA